MNKKEAESFGESLGDLIGDLIVEALAPLKARITELESSAGNLKYTGTWKAAKQYRKGNFCTHGGALWHANEDQPSDPPGKGNGWVLAVKAPR
jgi:hypothetical protein